MVFTGYCRHIHRRRDYTHVQRIQTLIYIYAFVVIFNSTMRIELPYPTLQECWNAYVMVEADPSRLYYNRDDIDTVEYGCIRRIKPYVEYCEQNPTDYGRVECHEYWKEKRQ